MNMERRTTPDLDAIARKRVGREILQCAMEFNALVEKGTKEGLSIQAQVLELQELGKLGVPYLVVSISIPFDTAYPEIRAGTDDP